MLPKSAILLSSLACILPASAQPVLPGYDFIKASGSFVGGMHFDDTDEEVQLYQFEARSPLSAPIYPTDNFLILPVLQYKGTIMDFRDTGSEDLHSISLGSFFLYSAKESPWIFGAYLRAELASDFEHVSSDSVTYDVMGGAGYKFSDSLTVGLGVAAINLNNDEEFFFGPAFDWKPNECFRLGLLGANIVASYTPDENWQFSLRGDASGDEWNVETEPPDGASSTLDLDSYRVGLYVDRRLTGDLWLRVGGGMTVANSIELETAGGDRIAKDDLDEGWFGEITLRYDIW